MNAQKRARLAAAGFVETSASNLLGLSPADEAAIEERLAIEKAKEALALLVIRARGKRLTQTQVAARIGSTQASIARIESAGKSASIDIMIRAALAAGATLTQIGNAIAGSGE